MKLGSLFDGSGGFPLAGAIHGIKPVWASEIEAYPIRVTKARFPNMEHLGSVLDVKGDQIAPVDIVTFGSPCQDLSVAGKQKGIHEGERSSLFFEAVRIAKEMRARDRATGRSDVDVRPRFLVWENVPGAFSSHQGEDFRAVLEALGGIAQDGVSIPRPPKGKWEHAGCVVGDGWSIAWRLYDAQYWGVPQRRKRIYLVADLASERAGEILFERESLCGDPVEGGEAREGIANDAQGSVGGGCTAFHLQQDPINGNVSPCIGGQHQATVGVVAAFKGGQGAKAGGIGYQEDVAPTLTHTPSGTQGAPDVVYPTVARTLTAEHDASPCVDRGQNMLCYALKGNAIDRNTAQNGRPWSDGASYTLDATDRHGVVHSLDCRNMRGQFEISGTLQAKPNGGQSLNYQNPVIYDTTQITSPLKYSNPKPGDPCHPLAAQQHPPLAIAAHDMRGFGDYGDGLTGSTLKARDYKGATDLVIERQERRYIVRRLTPLECCRLQGFPDWWEDGVEGSDSARYKMWGNGIALPCAADVLGRIAKELKEVTP